MNKPNHIAPNFLTNNFSFYMLLSMYQLMVSNTYAKQIMFDLMVNQFMVNPKTLQK